MTKLTGRDLPVDVEPQILRWLLDSSGWTEPEIGRKLKVGPGTVENWLDGRGKLSLAQVEALSGWLKRPLAAFFLPAPPKERPAPRDYRMLPGKTGIFSKKTLLAMRRARRMQTISRELMINLEMKTAAISKAASITDDPESIAPSVRENLGISVDAQKGWKNVYEAFTAWREAINVNNIMVFQMPMPLEDARGFSLVDDEPFVIIVNSSDTPEARIFTLLHEYGHILLKEAGICFPNNVSKAGYERQTIERWCNEFAAAVLLPKAQLEKDLEGLRKQDYLGRECLVAISRRYKVSKSALLLFLAKNRYISWADHDSAVERAKQATKARKKGFAAMPAEKKVLQERGKKYITLVAKNVRGGNISKIDAMEYLSVKLPNLEKVMAYAER